MERKKLNVKAIKQMCSVPGCANRGSYTIARTRHFGGVNVCEDCLREALAFIAPVSPPKLPTLKELLLDDRFKEELKKAIDDGVREGLDKAGITVTDDAVTSDGDSPDIDNKGDSPDTAEAAEDETAPADGEAVVGDNVQGNSENPVSEKQFVCDKCGKVCASQTGLTSHKMRR